MPFFTSRGRCTVVAALIAFSLLAAPACRESPTEQSVASTASGPGPTDAPAFLIACVDPAAGCSDNTDTHVTADISFTTTYTSTTPASFVDPVTGATTNVLSVSTPAVAVHVEAGYLPNGTPRVTTSYTAGPTPQLSSLLRSYSRS
jgi:hypothetical protein